MTAPRAVRGALPLALAVAALAIASAGCGETLVDHRGAGILGNAASCGEGQVICDGVCTTQSVSVCGASCSACPLPPDNATEVCTPVGAGGHDGTCDFRCDAGLLRCGSGCCSPALVAAGGEFSCATTTTGAVHCFGAGDVGQLGDGGAIDRATAAELVGIPEPVTALVAGDRHACAIAGGSVRCWGNGAAFGAAGVVLAPQLVPSLAGASAMAAGKSHTCGIVAGQVRCVGTTAGAGGGTPALPGAAFAVAAGDRFSCALVEDAGGLGTQVWCWGFDDRGELGDGIEGTSSATPLQVGPTMISTTATTQLSAGAHHACAAASGPNDKDETLWCWGDNQWNQLGDFAGALLPPTPSVRVQKKPIVRLAAGDRATCAVEDDAAWKLSCWSSDPLVAGGAGVPGEANPVASAPLAAAPVAVSAGALHTCYVAPVGTPVAIPKLHCFGTGGRGRLGNGTGADSAGPVLVIER